MLVQMLWLTLYSAGVGRTGTFICIDNVLDQIKKEKVVDIAGAINKMRHQRMKMVQTHVRLYIKCIHETCVDGLAPVFRVSYKCLCNVI